MDNEDDAFQTFTVCDWCEATIEDTSDSSGLCAECEDEYDRANPHPLDVAEMEDLEDRSAGLEDPWWRQP